MDVFAADGATMNWWMNKSDTNVREVYEASQNYLDTRRTQWYNCSSHGWTLTALVGMGFDPSGFLLPKSKWCGWVKLPPGFLLPVKE